MTHFIHRKAPEQSKLSEMSIMRKGTKQVPLMFTPSAEVSDHRLCPSLGYVYSVG